MFSWEGIGRKKMRLPGYDYSRSGLYFITICTQNRRCVFGRIANLAAPAAVGTDAPVGPLTNQTDIRMELSPFGMMVDEYWRDIPNSFSNMRMREYVVMPNHIHGIIEIIGIERGPTGASVPTVSAMPTPMVAATAKPRKHYDNGTISDAMKWFKSISTNAYIRKCRMNHVFFDRRLWQLKFHDSIIRNKASRERISVYIQNNPAEWDRDEHNPDRH